MALSMSLRSPDVIRYRVSVKPGLSSHTKTRKRPPDLLIETVFILFYQGKQTKNGLPRQTPLLATHESILHEMTLKRR